MREACLVDSFDSQEQVNVLTHAVKASMQVHSTVTRRDRAPRLFLQFASNPWLSYVIDAFSTIPLFHRLKGTFWFCPEFRTVSIVSE